VTRDVIATRGLDPRGSNLDDAIAAAPAAPRNDVPIFDDHRGMEWPTHRRSWDQDNLALGFELRQIGVLKDLVVDRHRHAFLDLRAEARKAPIWPADREALPNAQSCSSS
jgi:hypothetical protein